MAYHQIYHFQLFLLISSCFVLSSYAFQLNVGGQQGWVVNPDENYNNWAGRMRFQVNDTLLFKYSKGDSVLVVNKDDYDKCNTDKPIMKFDDGNSIFKFDRSGPFYFISGNKANCEKGQKMIVVVLAVRNRPPVPTPPTVPTAPGQSPMASPPTGPSPISPSPSMASPPTGPSPISPSPSPSGGSTTPALSPAPALSPTAKPPSTAPTPAGSATSPSPANQTPVPSPEGLTPAPAVTPASSSSPSPSSVSSPPSPLSPTTNPGSPGLSPPGGAGTTPGAPTSGNTPADIHSPTGSPPGGSSAPPAFTPSAVLFSIVSLVLCGLVVFI